MLKKVAAVLLVVCSVQIACFAYGPRGHGLVGAIADAILKNMPVQSRISKLLDGMPLQRAATIPDEIKSWDGRSRDQMKDLSGVSPRINDELRDFVTANPKDSAHPGEMALHRVFHYTDVPVAGKQAYSSGALGRDPMDIVHMIPYCVGVLKGKTPSNNPRKITKSVAVILLAHYVGDIHQPLHVGAEYFDNNGKVFDPTGASQSFFSDQGGNRVKPLVLAEGEFAKLHGYWDGDAVDTAFGSNTTTAVASQLAKKEPAKWKLAEPVEGWAQKMADEILPIAREAHARLKFSAVKLPAGQKGEIISARADEIKPSGNKPGYAAWAGNTVKTEIHKAGWRLAELLSQTVK